YKYDDTGKLTSYQWKGSAAQSVKDGTEVDPDGYIHTIAVDREGNLSKGYNDGARYTYFATGETWDVYAGPPEHTFKGANALVAAKNQPEQAIAKVIAKTIKEFGPIKDKNDPRLPILLEASKHRSPEIRIAATSILLDKSSTGLPAETK